MTSSPAFDSEVIVDCLCKSLPRTELPFCGFYRLVAEYELDLFKFPSRNDTSLTDLVASVHSDYLGT
jgi:hypothetical protein